MFCHDPGRTTRLRAGWRGRLLRRVPECHIYSCFVMVATAEGFPAGGEGGDLVGKGHGRAAPSFGSCSSGAPARLRSDPLPRAFACGRGRVSAPARFARLIARTRGGRRARRFRRPLPAGVAKCHAMSCSPCLRRRSAVPFLHIVPPSRSVLLRSVRPAAGPASERPFIARICVRARARVGADAVRAPDCPREAGAGRTSPVG